MRDATNAPSPKVLEYFPEKRDEHASTRIVVIAPIAAALVGAYFGRRWGILGAVAAATVALFYARALRKRPAARFAISGSRLRVTGERGNELLDITLDKLEAVKLGTRTVETVFQERSLGARAGPYRVGGAISTFRIELVVAEQAIPLTEYHTSSIDAEHWLSQMLKFLTSNGWTPLRDQGLAAGTPRAEGDVTESR